MKDRSVLITGATGIMGGWVLGEALRRGYSATVLMRDADPINARERLASVLRLVGQDGGVDRVRIVQGDTRQENLGLEPDQVAHLRSSLGGIVHCAACTSFNTRMEEELNQTNVGGIRNVLDFVTGADIPLFHVSTAYVAGDRTGRVLETEIDDGQRFNNTYEKTKFESELLVQQAIADGRVRAAIFRPAIIVGATTEGRISQFLNFYSFLRFVDVASAHELSSLRRLRIQANPNATKNLVPVDWTAQALWQVIEAEGASGETYHLTNPNPSVLQHVVDWANEMLGPRNVQVDIVEQFAEKASALEVMLNASFRYYRPYTRYEPVFDRSNTDRALGASLPFPTLGYEQYDKMLGFARQQRWQGIFGCQPDSEDAGYEARITRFFPKLAAQKAEKISAAAERIVVAR